MASDLQSILVNLEASQSSERKLKQRVQQLEDLLVQKEAELDSLRALPDENRLIRAENISLREKLREVEAQVHRTVELGSLGAESQAQASVKLQAYQRHNHFLQGELAVREAKCRSLQERIDVLSEEVHQKDRRCTILNDRVRQLSGGAEQSRTLSVLAGDATAPAATSSSTFGLAVSVPEEILSQMKQKLSSQSASMELLQERLETLQEDAQRRDLLVEALQRENGALRQSVSRLIAQVNGTHHNALLLRSSGPSSATATHLDTMSVLSSNTATNATDGLQAKLKTYRAQRITN